MASTYLTRTFGTATNRDKGTLSFWMKTSNSAGGIVGNYTNDTNRAILYWGNGSIKYYDGAANVEYNATARVLRDPNAWYHIVLMINTADGTQADRVRIYINGERQSPIAGNQAYNQNENSHMFNPTSAFSIGRDTYSSGAQDYFNGAISHFHYCDGQAYDASSFGETDTTTGEWKAKTSPSVTYGSQGFFILKNSNSVTDQSGNSNNFTVGGGTLTDLKDNPDNVFATLNPLCNGSNTTLSKGNTVTTGNTASDSGMSTVTLPVASSGKYYWEMKITGSHADYPKAGIFKNWEAIAQGTMNGASGGAFQLDAYIQKGLSTLVSDDGNISITAPANNNIIMYALDSVNGKFYIGNNGTWYNNGNPTSGSTGTGSVLNLTSGNINMIGTHEYNGSISNWNFGNGYFGTTAVTTNSGNGYSGAEGASKFNYTVPTGYSALSTKGLNE